MSRDVIADARKRMQKTVDDLAAQLASFRTGRASVHLLDNVMVDYYGTMTPIGQLSTLHAPEPNLITVQPWDISQLGQIEKAIMVADLGLNPNNDGKVIRVPIPPLPAGRLP